MPAVNVNIQPEIISWALSQTQKEKLGEKYIFEIQGRTDSGTIVRFCTSWATTQAETDALIRDIEQL